MAGVNGECRKLPCWFESRVAIISTGKRRVAVGAGEIVEFRPRFPAKSMFFVMALLIGGSAYGWVGWRLLRRLEKGSRWRWVIAGALGLQFVSVFASFALLRTVGPGGWAAPIYWMGYGGLGLFSLLFTGLVAVELGWLGARGVDAVCGTKALPADEGRRRALLGAWYAGVAGVTVLGGVHGFRQARRRPTVVKVEVPIVNLPKELAGYRIAQISDVHLGPTISGSFLRTVVGMVNELGTDMVAVTGDLVDGSTRHIRGQVAALADVQSRDGTFFVTGNHEYYSGAEAWCDTLTELGLKVLKNNHAMVARGKAQLLVAGVTDYRAHRILPTHRSSPTAALAGAPRCDVKILLAHQPKSCLAAQRHGFDLQLSGHTHGGQMFPWNFVVGRFHPFVRGLNRFGRGWVYVNQGTGYWGPPMRIGAPAEITLLTLKRG